MFDQGLLDHLSTLSYLPPDSWALALILGIDLLFTLVHSIQELNGRLWRYFSAIAGVRVPDGIGFLLFSLVLTVVLWALGFAGIAGYLPFVSIKVPAHLAIVALGALIGGRLSDLYFSHVRLDRQGYRPNPGLASTPLYCIEAVALAALFLPGLKSYPTYAALGFLVGILFFYSVLPLLRLLRFISALRQDSWKPGGPIPG